MLFSPTKFSNELRKITDKDIRQRRVNFSNRKKNMFAFLALLFAICKHVYVQDGTKPVSLQKITTVPYHCENPYTAIYEQ